MTTFGGYLTAAPLKPPHAAFQTLAVMPFRGYLTAATLKLPGDLVVVLPLLLHSAVTRPRPH